jgi:hypothetical protein
MEGANMDFIERLLGISPDGGDGSAEMLIIGAIVLLLAALSWRFLIMRGRGRAS